VKTWTDKIVKVGGPIPPVKDGERLIRYTSSLCPHCFRVLPAIIVERDGKMYIRRICPEHGEVEEIYFSDAELYRKFEKFDFEGGGAGYVYTASSAPCPLSCGLCPLHKSHTALLNMVVTNRCDLSCWYCFYFAERAGYVYEPTLDQIRYMIRQLKKQPLIVPVVQLTGGEPTLRDDLVEIVKLLRDEGVRHIQLNTHGIKFAKLFMENEEKAVNYVRELRSAGVNTVYMSFDGVTPKTNPKNHWEVPLTFEAFRRGDMTSVVLVPTVINTVNTDELGDILRFAAHNIDIVRGVNFQPVSLVGMMRKQDREKYRITIPDAIRLIEEQTNGEITKNDWYPVSAEIPFAAFLEALDRNKRVEFTNHPACGAATYVYVERRGEADYHFVPITRFVRVDEMLDYLYKRGVDLQGKPLWLSKLNAFPAVFDVLRKFIEWDKVPEELRKELRSILLDIFFKRSYEALGRFHYKMLFVGMMHFMDEWNYDVQRVMRCNIHYTLPDGRIVPFCAFNILNDIYRDAAQQKWSIPLDEYLTKFGKDAIYGQKYVRTPDMIKKMVRSEYYKKTYQPFIEKLREFYPDLL